MSAPALTDKQRDARELQRVRDKVGMLRGSELMRAQDEHGALLESESDGEILPIARFLDRATEDDIRLVCDSLHDLRFMLGLYDRAVRAYLDLRGPAEPAPQPTADTTKDYAAEAAMRCAEPAFKKYLEDKHGLERPLTDDRCAQKLRSVLAIQSRRELNETGPAAERWKALKGDFETWKRTGR